MLKNTTLIAVFCLAPAAFALNNRSAVSSTGLDTNPCTVASPCRSFGAAIAVTSPSGEIIALDSAGYGPFSIGGAVTISGAPGVHAAISVTSGDGIDVNAGASDRVILRNLVLIGGGGVTGIFYNQAGELRVLNCLIRGFSACGISSSGSKLVIDHAAILDQSAVEASGIAFGDTASPSGMTITNSLIDGNDLGVYVGGNAAVVIAFSTIVNGGTGILVSSSIGTGAIPASVTVESSTIAFEGTAVNLTTSGGNNSATAYLSQDNVAYNVVGVNVAGASIAYSFLNNRFDGNTSDGSALASIALK